MAKPSVGYTNPWSEALGIFTAREIQLAGKSPQAGSEDWSTVIAGVKPTGAAMHG